MPAFWWSTRTVKNGAIFSSKKQDSLKFPHVVGGEQEQVVKVVPNIDAGGSNKKNTVYI